MYGEYTIRLLVVKEKKETVFAKGSTDVEFVPLTGEKGLK